MTVNQCRALIAGETLVAALFLAAIWSDETAATAGHWLLSGLVAAVWLGCAAASIAKITRKDRP